MMFNAIKVCRVCQSPNLVDVLFLGTQYVCDFVTPDGNSPQAPLDLVRCSSCGLVQLRHTFSRGSLYRHYWYKSGISPTMRKALSDLVSRTCEIAKPSPSELVLDIGCNDGTLLRSYPIKGLFLVGFEPAENLVQEARNGTNWIFNDFFSAETFKRKFSERKAKIVTSVAMFYDLEDPNSFVDDVSQILARHGLEVFDVETNRVNGGSIRTFICHKGLHPIRNSVNSLEKQEDRLALKEQATYEAFADNIKKIRTDVHEFVAREVGSGKTVYVYGASNRGNTILQYCGLDHALIGKAADANSEKWGRKTVGTLIPIVSKDEARRDQPDYFLILPHHFLDEIAKEEKAYLENGGKFIVPLPKFRILDA